MNCRPHHWDVVGHALFYAFDETIMLDKFTPVVRDSWIIIYNFLSFHMINGMLAKFPHLADDQPKPSTKGVLERPAKKNEVVIVPEKVAVVNSESTSSEDIQKIDCSKHVPASAITFSMVTTVISSWEHSVKRIPKWEHVFGEIFLRKIFELDSDTIVMFGFPEDTKFDDPALRDNAKFMGKAIRFIKGIDMIVNFLGPDLLPLETELFDLGGRHGYMNCRPHHWDVVGHALFYAFDETIMKDKFTPEVRDSWIIIYNFLSFHMIKGMLAKFPHLADDQPKPSTKGVLERPAKKNEVVE
jgi:hemoglobin-like flavoprotein